MITSVGPSPLDDPQTLPLLPTTAVMGFGSTLVVAPHQDDESLGCGGAIALLRRAGIPVTVLFVSDGTGSHPNSRAYPPQRLCDTREAEALAALALLGVRQEAAIFLRLPDTAVPLPGQTDFAAAVERVGSALDAAAPQTILLPWRRDPHGDHRAAWALVHAALARKTIRPRLLEYPIWVWELGEARDLPRPGEVMGWRLAIDEVASQKGAAIAAHRSQTTALIADDPAGFRLLPRMLAHFAAPWEIYLESPAPEAGAAR